MTTHHHCPDTVPDDAILIHFFYFYAFAMLLTFMSHTDEQCCKLTSPLAVNFTIFHVACSGLIFNAHFFIKHFPIDGRDLTETSLD